MDLREQNKGQTGRHPWELARLDALSRILAAVDLPSGARVLDVGCGDGFAGQGLLPDRSLGSLVGLDANFSDEQLARFRGATEGGRYVRGFEEISGERFDVVLLLDVIEHLVDDRGLLLRVRSDHMADGAVALVTVPAFQSLFSAHDRFLLHQRRYRRSALLRLAADAGLRPLRSGYLFASLLLPRLMALCWERLSRSERAGGLGTWRGGASLTGAVRWVLGMDNRFLLALAGRGVFLPGLSAWMLCKKPPS